MKTIEELDDRMLQYEYECIRFGHIRTIIRPLEKISKLLNELTSDKNMETLRNEIS